MGSPPAQGRLGEEWIVDAEGCDPARLRDLGGARAMLDEIVRALSLHVVVEPQLHKFGGEGGVTALYLLGESHLALHTYPEHACLTLNLYSCRPRPAFDYQAYLARHVGAEHVSVRCIARGASGASERET